MGHRDRELIESTGIKIPELIHKLNKALSDEWLAYYQYWIGAKIAVGVPRAEVVDELQEHASEELEHAEKLADRIVQLGGTPVLDPKMWFELASCRYAPPKKPDLASVLEQNILAERCAISVYHDLIEYTRGKDLITYQMLLKIYKDEIDHEDDLENLLRDIKTLTKKT